jgi:RNA polymerase sigma factor (sigma-70 family)
MQTSISDTELIIQFQETGDDAIFNQIFKCHEKLLKRLRYKFLNLLNIGISISELEQEILISFFQAVQKYNPERGMKFSTFCYTHIQHDMCDLYGKQCNHYKNITDNNIILSDSDDGETTLDLLSSIPDPQNTHDRYLENDYYNCIREYISSLDPITQTICTDHLVNGLTQRQIAESLNISAMHVNRTIKQFNNQLHQIILEN